MQYVGSELERLALSNTDPNNADLLGRSAFNRYYYAAFLVTRETLGYMQSNWRGTQHANIPELLTASLEKKAKQYLTRQRRKGLITLGQESRLLTKLRTTASELAQLLTQAYDARILADYEPEIKTVKDQNVICLKSHKLTTARQWPEQADRYCGRLKRIWRDIGLA